MASSGAMSWISSLPFGSSSRGPSKVDTLDEWLAALLQPASLTELAALIGCGLLAWLLTRLLQRVMQGHEAGESSILFGKRIIDGVLFPLLLLLLTHLTKGLLAQVVPLAIYKVALPALLALAVIRLSVKVLQTAFKNAPWVRALERTFSWLAWLAMVLWVSGLLPVLLEELDGIKWKVGQDRKSTRLNSSHG